MDNSNGRLYPREEIPSLPPEQQSRFVEVKRDLTKLEEAQRQINLYSPCGCGSGKKFKFFCFKPAA